MTEEKTSEQHEVMSVEKNQQLVAVFQLEVRSKNSAQTPCKRVGWQAGYFQYVLKQMRAAVAEAPVFYSNNLTFIYLKKYIYIYI